MAHASTERVQLKFSNLDEVTLRLDQLRSAGYTRVGKWNLAQVCEHLYDWMVYPLDGYPTPPLLVRPLLWAMKVTVGKTMLNRVIESGSMPAGGPTMSRTVHAAKGIEDASSVERLKTAIQRFKTYRGEFHQSPLFGVLSAERGLALQLVHCAHHLSFLVPKP